MTPAEKYFIYSRHCGHECPIGLKDCEFLFSGSCSLDEPWKDCDYFRAENMAEIFNAEDEIREKEGDKPIQVRFTDDEYNINYGIMYHDKVICAHCGAVFDKSEVHDIVRLKWIDFSEAIGE